jgi:peptidoglycan/xylan/chitin deacetylase (PgdA/CDA1 family)
MTGRRVRAQVAITLALAATVVALAGCAVPLQRAVPLRPSAVLHVAASASNAASAAAAAAEQALVATLPPITGRIVEHGSRNASRTIALTFDLCATTDDTETLDRSVVATLRAKDASATFMMGGLWAEAHPREAASLAKNPRFEIGNHSMTHPHLRALQAPDVRTEILDAQRTIVRLTGRRPRVFRFPFEESDPRTIRVLGSCGLVGISEDVRTGDPDPNISADRLVQYVVDVAQPGSIVIMHANGNGVHTAEALPRMIDGLRRHGFRLVTVSEMLGLDTEDAPQ